MDNQNKTKEDNKRVEVGLGLKARQLQSVDDDADEVKDEPSETQDTNNISKKPEATEVKIPKKRPKKELKPKEDSKPLDSDVEPSLPVIAEITVPEMFVESLKKTPEKKFLNKSFNVSTYCFEAIDSIYKNSNYTRNDFLVKILNMYLVDNISPEFDLKVKNYVKEILDRKTDGDTARRLVNIKASVSLHNNLDMRIARLKVKIPTLSKGYFLESIVMDFIRHYINPEMEGL